MRKATNDAAYNDVNYVFPTWITTALPIGIVGLWIAAIITAATDSIAAELNSLSTASVIDFYKRLVNPNDSDAHYLLVSRVTTGFWGIFAGFVAVYASSLGSLIEVVNRFGSFFYGSILGVFMLAILTRRATGTGAFVGLLCGMVAVASVAFGRPDISFLWHNVIGAVVVFTVGLSLSIFYRRSGRSGEILIKDLLISFCSKAEQCTFVEIDFTIADSPLGRLLLAATARGVCCVMIGDSDRMLEKDLRKEYPHAIVRRNDRILTAQVRSVLEHLRGKSPHVELPTDVRATAFQWRVWRQLQAIPYGETRTYRRSGCRHRQADGDPRRRPRLRDQSGGAADPLSPRHRHGRFTARISMGHPTKRKAARAGAGA